MLIKFPVLLTGYISTAINDGPGCLMLRCPDPSCSAAVGQDMVNLFASDEDKGKYERYLCRSYIEDNRKVSPYLSELYLNSKFLFRAPSAAQLGEGW